MNRLALLAMLLFPLLGGCACNGQPWVELRGERFCVEIADDDRERIRGLMFRTELAADAGMLFLFEEQAPRAFWMMNTKIPLDILYFDEQLRLVSAARRVPPCRSSTRCPSYPSEAPARYVLELNAGVADRLGVEAGDVLTLAPGILP